MRLLVLAAASTALLGCPPEKDGVVDTVPEPTPGVLSAPALIYGVPNLDDDDRNGTTDWDEEGPAEDNERVALTVELTAGQLEMALSGESARIWMDSTILLDTSTPAIEITVDGPLDLEVEFDDFAQTGNLDLVLHDEAGEQERATVALQSAPLLLNHHLQVAEQVYAVTNTGYRGNELMIAGFTDALGAQFTAPPASDYDYDVWVQDELEFGTAIAGDHRLDVVIDSIRSQHDKYLDTYPETVLQAPDVAVHTWGSGSATSQDSFGDLDTAPPVTVDGVAYPFGRIYYGEWRGQGPTDALTEMLAAQGMQDPFTLDTTWLCVGHVDEFSTFLPDPTAPHGFRLLMADTDLGWALLQGMDPTTALSHYKSGHGYPTVGDILADSGLEAYNQDVQRDDLDVARETFELELGLTEADIIRIPALYEENSQCYGLGLALIPGTLNMAVDQPDPDGPTVLFIPDPFLREDDVDQAADPLITAVNAVLPANVEPLWLDDWRLYHMAWGEIHCGSNTRRTPMDGVEAAATAEAE